jgi:hypothetical protein
MKPPDLDGHPTVALRRLHRWRMALSGLAILIAGITIGAAGAVLVIRPIDHQPPPDVDAAVAGMIGRFQDVLNLSLEQVGKIRAILRQRMENLEKIRTEARPKIEEQLQAMKREIDEVLTEEQRDNWERITGRLDMEFRRGMRRGGPGGPGDGFRDGRRRPPRGDRPNGDANDVHRSGQRRFGRGDPNDPRRPQEWWGDPNSPPRRGGPRPDWQGRDEDRRPFDRRPDVNDRVPDPNMRDRPVGPPEVFLDPGGL